MSLALPISWTTGRSDESSRRDRSARTTRERRRVSGRRSSESVCFTDPQNNAVGLKFVRAGAQVAETRPATLDRYADTGLLTSVCHKPMGSSFFLVCSNVP